MYGATAGQVGILRFSATTNQAICGILPNKHFIPEFLYYFFLHHKKHLIAQAVGNAQPNISQVKIKETEVPLVPLVEQQRMVAILDEAFEAIATAKANTEKNLQNARALFESHLDATFGSSADDWHEGALDEIVHPQCALSYGIVQPGEEFDDGVPIVRPTDLKQKYIELDGLKRVDPEIADSFCRTKLVGNEFLLCVRGATGAVSIATPELAGGNVTRGIVPIRFAENRVLPEFAFHLLNAPPVQRQIKEKTYGTALMQINIKDLRELRISVPPLHVQKTLAARLDDLYDETRTLESIYARKHAALDALKTSLLHQAFTGNL
jgi:type I restriction enzyme S subunit